MIFVYLDQCAVSSLADRRTSQWVTIRELLEDGFKAERIVCPVATETLFESAPCSAALRSEVMAFFSKVSAGYRFRDLGELIIDNSVALIRPDFEVHCLEKFAFYDWADQNGLALSLKDFRDRQRDRLREIVSEHVYPPEANHMTIDEIFSCAARERSDALIRDLGHFLEEAKSMEGFEIPWLIEGLIKHQMSDPEIELLREAVRSGKWVGIMENKIDLLLVARWNLDRLQRGRTRYDPNDEIDRWRAVVALSRSDLFITDQGTADLCGRVEPIRGLPAEVIPVNQPEEIIRFVQSSITRQNGSPNDR